MMMILRNTLRSSSYEQPRLFNRNTCLQQARTPSSSCLRYRWCYCGPQSSLTQQHHYFVSPQSTNGEFQRPLHLNLQHRRFGSEKSAKVKATIVKSNAQQSSLITPEKTIQSYPSSSNEQQLQQPPASVQDDYNHNSHGFSPLSSSSPAFSTASSSSSSTFITPTLIRTDLSDHVTWRNETIPPIPDFNTPSASIADPFAQTDWENELVDFKDLYDPEVHMRTVPKSWKGFEMSTPLFEEFMKTILIKGKALTVAHFMQQVLTNPEHGYYRNHQRQDDISWDDDIDKNEDDDLWETSPQQSRSMIGPKGDFVTAPEISQIFGESIAVWFITQWKAVLFRSLRLRLIELGPGKGTLIHDIIRAAHLLEKGFFKSIREIHLVEQSGALRQMQKEMLQSIDFVEWEFFEPQNNSATAGTDTKNISDAASSQQSVDQTAHPTIKVKWHNYFSQVVQEVKQNDTSNPKMANLIVAQEFLDALPIHVFVKTPQGWRERLVDLGAFADDVEELEEDILSGAARKETLEPESASSESSSPLKPRLRFVTASDVTAAVSTLLHVDPKTGKGLDPAFDAAPEGQVLEVCPEGILLVQDLAQLIEDHGGGCALLIDYGQVGSTDSLRGYSQHQQVHPLSRPGLVDVTADVDFGAIRHAVNHRTPTTAATKTTVSESKSETKSEDTGELSIEEEFADFFYEDDKKAEKTDTVEEVPQSATSGESDTPPPPPMAWHGAITAFGPITQGKFLASMGAIDRISRFIENDKTTDEEANLAYQALEKLVSPEQMGERYKVLAISAKKDGIFEPAGFDGGDVLP